MSAPVSLAEAAQRRRIAAEERVATTLKKIAKLHLPVTFTGVAEMAAVSTDFIYRLPDIRSKIEGLRTRSGTHQSLVAITDAKETNIIRVLTAQVQEERRARHDETTKLREALAVAHAELLRLRRSLADHGDQSRSN